MYIEFNKWTFKIMSAGVILNLFEELGFIPKRTHD